MHRSRYLTRFICVASCCVLLFACSRNDETRPGDTTASIDTGSAIDTADAVDMSGAPIRTDRYRYTATVMDAPQRHVELSIPMIFVNMTDAPVYLLGCGHPTMPLLQKRDDDTWVTAYAPIELQCLSPPWAVRPGETYRDTLLVYGMFPGQDAGPTFDTDVKGTYRLLRSVYADSAGKVPLPDSLRMSAPFEIEAAADGKK